MVVGGKTFCLAGLRRCMAGRQAGREHGGRFYTNEAACSN